MNKIEILLNNQLLEVDLNDLKGNDDTLIAILNQDVTNHKLFLEFAVRSINKFEYHKRGMKTEFEKFLFAGKKHAVDFRWNNSTHYLLLVNTLAAYFIEICKKLNDQDTIEIHGQEQSSKDLLTKVAQWLNEMEQISKSEKFTFINKGNLLMLRAKRAGQELDQCVTAYKLALKLDSNFMPGLIGLATVYCEKGDFKSALPLYQKMLCLKPEMTPDVRLPIGMCFYNLGMAEEAKKAFDRVLERNPKDVDAIMFLSLIDFNASKTEKSKNQKKLILKEANAKVIKAYQIDPRNALCALQMSERFFEKDLHKSKVMAQSSLLHIKSPRLKAEAYILLGRIAHVQQDYKTAIENYKLAAKFHPGSNLIQFPLAQLYISQGHVDEAIQCLEKILITNPQDYDTLKLLFSVYSSNSATHDKAQTVLDSLNKLLGNSDQELLIQDTELVADIAAFLETTNVQQARKKYHLLLNLMEEQGVNPPPELLNNVAVLYHMEADGINAHFDKDFRMNYRIGVEGTDQIHESNVMISAESIYQRALVAVASPEYAKTEEPWKVNALQTTIRYNVARLFETRGELDKAEAHLKEILKIHPAYDDCLVRLGYIEQSRKNYEKALDYYSDALAIDPQNPLAWYMIGNHFMQIKSYRAARRSFEKVLENNKHDSYALCSAGNLCLIFARGDPKPENRALHFKRAVEYFCKAISVDPLNVHAAGGIGIAYAESQNLNESVAIQELAPGDPSLTLITAHILVEMKQFQAAITLYDSLVKKRGFKNDTVVLSALARVYYIIARTNKDVEAMKLARRYAQKVVFVNPSDKTNLFNMALLEQQSASVLNDQPLENRSIEALKAAVLNLDLSASIFNFLAQQQASPQLGYDVGQANDRAKYGVALKKVTEKKIHETEVLQRQRQQRLEEIKEKMRIEEEEKKAREEALAAEERRKELEIEAKRKEIQEQMLIENEKARTEKKRQVSSDEEGETKKKSRKKKKAPESDDEENAGRGKKKKSSNAIIDSDSE